MKNYTIFEITEGMYCDLITTFNTFNDALTYIKEEYGIDNVVEQIVQIHASNPKEEIGETFTPQEIYDIIAKEGEPHD